MTVLRFERWWQAKLAEPLMAPPAPLCDEVFVPVSLRPIVGASVVWLNWTALRDLGFTPASQAERAAVEATILASVALRLPEADDAPGSLGSEEQTWWADRYGDGAAPNFGSGRAAARGAIQLKGIGATALVNPASNYAHRSGALRLEAALREAVWGEIFNREMPFGANRVLAVIDAGAALRTDDGVKHRRGILVRTFPVRPTHFIPHENYRVSPDTLRAQTEAILRVLPRASIDGEPTAQLIEFACRMARQHARAIVRRIPHGALNASNSDIYGRLVDYGTSSSQPGHGLTTILPPSMRAQVKDATAFDMVGDLVRSVVTNLGLAPDAVDAAAVRKRFALEFGYEVFHELVHLCGFPTAIVRDALTRKPYWSLAAALHKTAFEHRINSGGMAGDVQNIYSGLPRSPELNDLAVILPTLARVYGSGAESAASVLRPLCSAAALDPLLRAYFEFRAVFVDDACGGTAEERDELVLRLSCARNEERRFLYLSRARAHFSRSAHRVARSAAAIPAVRAFVDGVIVREGSPLRSTSGSTDVIREVVDRDSASLNHLQLVYEHGAGYAVRLAMEADPHSGFLLHGASFDPTGCTAVVTSQCDGVLREVARVALSSDGHRATASVAISPADTVLWCALVDDATQAVLVRVPLRAYSRAGARLAKGASRALPHGPAATQEKVH